MNITIFINEISGGGAERVACNLANHLLGIGHHISILTLTRTDTIYNLDEQISVTPLVEREDYSKIGYFVRLIISIKRYLKRNESDCNICFLPVATLLLLSRKRKTKGKTIVSERNDPSKYSRLIQNLLKHYAKYADGYVFQTEGALRWYEKYLNDTCHKFIIPNAINENFLRMEIAKNRRNVIVAVGRLSGQKNFELLIRAYKKAREHEVTAKLEIYGDGSNKEQLSSLVEELDLKEYVSFNGYVNDIEARIFDASLFVLSSNYEGMPNALIEAMALGIPCISTDCPCGGPKYIIENYENGILVPVNNVDEMASAIIKVMSSSQLRCKLSENGLKIRNKLAPQIIYNKWSRAISETCCK